MVVYRPLCRLERKGGGSDDSGRPGRDGGGGVDGYGLEQIAAYTERDKRGWTDTYGQEGGI